jgi:NDP-4-keto-2,6-dideoxyhexose 3-C-methyltransferase
LEPILDLGSLRISTFRLPEEPPPPTAPLTLARCAWCGLVQLTHTVNPDLLYKGRYWYRSSVNEVMRAELADVVDDALSRVTIDPQDVVVDIGANDGFLLSCYRDHPATLHTLRVGFEPSPNLRPSAQHTSEILIPDYFADGPVFRSAIAGRAKVVTAIAMVYDVDNLESFFSAVHHALHCDGVFVVQFQDLWGMLRSTAFDNICHEHLTYFSLHTFDLVARRYGLIVVDVEKRQINGGSLRVTLRAAETTQPLPAGSEHRLRSALAEEEDADDWETLERFAWRVNEAKLQIRGVLSGLSDDGTTIDLYAASTKANTLLQVCGLDASLLRQAWERSPEKVGRLTVTDVPIVSEETGRSDPPTALLLAVQGCLPPPGGGLPPGRGADGRPAPCRGSDLGTAAGADHPRSE